MATVDWLRVLGASLDDVYRPALSKTVDIYATPFSLDIDFLPAWVGSVAAVVVSFPMASASFSAIIVANEKD